MNTNQRIKDLEADKEFLQLKVSSCITWLLNKPYDHPDRSKIYSDKAYWECEKQRIEKKIENLKANEPENGTSLHLEVNNLNRETINKSTL